MSQNEQQRSILHIIHGLRVGGAEVDLLRKCTHLVANYPYQITICCLMRRGSLAHHFEALGVTVVGPLMRHRYDVFAGRKLRRILVSTEWDLVHTHLAAASLVTWLVNKTIRASMRVPTIASEHAMAERWNAMVLWLDRQMIRSLTYMTVPSSAAARSYIQQSLPEEKLKVIDNCVDLERFSDIDRTQAKARLCNELNISQSQPILGTVCRLEAVKALPMLFEATAKVDAHLIVAGDGTQRGSLEKLILASGWQSRIHLLGSRGDVPELLAAMDLFVLSSHSESFGMVIIEALLSMTPVVATNVGGIAEITKNGAYALLTDSGDSTAFRKAIEWAISHQNEMQKITKAGHNHVKQKYGIDQCSLQLHKLYTESISSSILNSE